MVIHNLRTNFSLLIAIVHTRDSKNIQICGQVDRLHKEICMRVWVCTNGSERRVGQ